MPEDVTPTHTDEEQGPRYGAVLRPLWGLEDPARLILDL